MFRRFKKATLLLVGMAAAGVPLVTTATCDPYTQTLQIYRDDDYRDRDWGVFDFFFDNDDYYSDCCYDYDYWF